MLWHQYNICELYFTILKCNALIKEPIQWNAKVSEWLEFCTTEPSTKATADLIRAASAAIAAEKLSFTVSKEAPVSLTSTGRL